MKTTNFHRLLNAPDALAAVRTTIERDFSLLLEEQPRVLRLALNEAEALAWQTGFPELIFPLLAQEKAKHVAAWHERQQSIREPGPILERAARWRRPDQAKATNSSDVCQSDFSFVPIPLRSSSSRHRTVRNTPFFALIFD